MNLNWHSFRKSLRIGRYLIRVCRFIILLFILCILASIVWLNVVGLPDFAKNAIHDELIKHGFDLNFSTARLSWHQGIVAEEINFGSSKILGDSQIFIDSLKIDLDLKCLFSGRFSVNSIELKNAKLSIPLQGSKHDQQFVIENLNLHLDFPETNLWHITAANFNCLGADFSLSGYVTNIVKAKMEGAKTTESKALSITLQNQLAKLCEVSKEIRYSKPPKLFAAFKADAACPWSVEGSIKFSCDNLSSKWINATNIFSSFYFDFQTNTTIAPYLNVSCEVKVGGVNSTNLLVNSLHVKGKTRISTKDRTFKDLITTVNFSKIQFKGATIARPDIFLQLVKQTNSSEYELDLCIKADNLADKTLQITRFDGYFKRAISDLEFNQILKLYERPILSNNSSSEENISLLLKDWKSDFSCQTVRLAQQELNNINAVIKFYSNNNTNSPIHSSAPELIHKIGLVGCDFNIRTDSAFIRSTDIYNIQVSGIWSPPTLEITQVYASLLDGQFITNARFDMAQLFAYLDCKSTIDFHKAKGFLTSRSFDWFSQFYWETPPCAEASVYLKLPNWPTSISDYKTDIRPFISIRGKFSANTAGYRGVMANSASAHFIFTNSVWVLPDLTVIRDEGTTKLAYSENTITRDFSWVVNGQFFPEALKPLIELNLQKKGFDLLNFNEPISVVGQVTGRWHQNDLLAFQTELKAKSFSFRNEFIKELTGDVCFSNHILIVKHAQMVHETGTVDVRDSYIDLTNNNIILSNAFCKIDPNVIARMIGPKTAKAIKPYKFDVSPEITINGIIPITPPIKPTLKFNIAGGPFSWWRFNLPYVNGTLIWEKDQLIITNLVSDCYDGRLNGNAFFDFSPLEGNDFTFNIAFSKLNSRKLILDAFQKTNTIDGLLTGNLNISKANTISFDSWQGSGNVSLENGLIWEISLFGIFTPILNSIWPGVAKSRATDAQASFVISNGIIRSDDLCINSPPLVLKYSGVVDFKGNVDARMEANLLRNSWLIGKVINLAMSPVTKLLEYKIKGTITNPKLEPVFIPKFLFLPLQPIKTLREIFKP